MTEAACQDGGCRWCSGNIEFIMPMGQERGHRVCGGKGTLNLVSSFYGLRAISCVPVGECFYAIANLLLVSSPPTGSERYLARVLFVPVGVCLCTSLCDCKSLVVIASSHRLRMISSVFAFCACGCLHLYVSM